jgi:hypothetical protein
MTMLICRTSNYVHLPIFGNVLTKLITMPTSKYSKLNSSKSTTENSQYPPIEKIHMQKYANIRFKHDEELG